MEREVLVERYSNRSQKGLGVGGKVESVENEGVSSRSACFPGTLTSTKLPLPLPCPSVRIVPLLGVPQSPGYDPNRSRNATLGMPSDTKLNLHFGVAGPGRIQHDKRTGRS